LDEGVMVVRLAYWSIYCWLTAGCVLLAMFMLRPGLLACLRLRLGLLVYC